MKIIVYSDSHGCKSKVQYMYEKEKDADFCFFLGDGIEDIEFVSEDHKNIAWIAVRGNCDRSPVFRGSMVKAVDSITLEGKKIVLTHGNLYGAKSGLGGLISLAREEGADILLFGHTHTPCEIYISEYEKPFYLFNPGAASGHGAGFGLIQLLPEKEPLLSHGSVRN